MITSTIERQPIVRIMADKQLENKKTYSLKMSPNGQVTIPKEMREELDWHPGDVLVFSPRKDGFAVSKRLGLREEVTKWRQGLSQEANDLIKKTAGWTINQYHEYFDNLPENIAKMEEEYGIQ